MKDATFLYNNSYMSLNALADRIISRSPSEIRIALWNSAGNFNNMFDFAKAAERVIPLAYGKEDSMNSMEVQMQQVKTFKSEYAYKFCELHGKKGHNTEECLTLKKLMKLGWSKNKSSGTNTNRAENKDFMENKKINFSNYFSCHSNFFYKNPFLLKGNIENNIVSILIDTDADLTLISTMHLPKAWTIKQSIR